MLRQMGDEGRGLLTAEGASPSDIEIHTDLELRYRGQAHQLSVAVNPETLMADALAADFQQLYYDTWSYRPDTTAMQIVNLRVTAIGKAPEVAVMPLNTDRGQAGVAKALKETRAIYFDGRFHDTPVYERSRLPLLARVTGPAIVDEEGSTTVVPPQWEVEVHTTGHLFLHRK
ncbi:MAG: hypothetical protein QF652_05605 [Dehalococcoidia bacterium]|nr:hypothetical protein [Dehalococcoidia bacterium]